MKLSAALILAATASVASASVRATASLMAKARRLEDVQQQEDQQQEEGDEFSFLAGFSAKVIGCASGEIYKSVNGETEYDSLIFRLCPADSCDADSAVGCKNGYGDYVIGLNSYVQAYVEQNRDNMMTDDANAMNPNQFAECRQYNYQAEDGSAEVYYVGPTCAGSSGVKLAVFSDETCTTLAEDVSFSDISGGASLPFSNGGLVGSGCEACSVTNDNGATEISQMCTNVYQYSGHCETKMQKNSQYSTNDESACEYIASISMSSTGGSAGAAIGWVIFTLCLLAGAGFAYTKWWVGRKQAQQESAIMS